MGSATLGFSFSAPRDPKPETPNPKTGWGLRKRRTDHQPSAVRRRREAPRPPENQIGDLSGYTIKLNGSAPSEGEALESGGAVPGATALDAALSAGGVASGLKYTIRIAGVLNSPALFGVISRVWDTMLRAPSASLRTKALTSVSATVPQSIGSNSAGRMLYSHAAPVQLTSHTIRYARPGYADPCCGVTFNSGWASATKVSAPHATKTSTSREIFNFMFMNPFMSP